MEKGTFMGIFSFRYTLIYPPSFLFFYPWFRFAMKRFYAQNGKYLIYRIEFDSLPSSLINSTSLIVLIIVEKIIDADYGNLNCSLKVWLDIFW